MSLLPPNATPLEKALESVTSRMSDIPVPIRDIWNPQKCPISLLPWLAWALSVDEWDSNWTEEQRRRTVAASVEVHRKKGTIGAVRKALEPFGLSNAIQEWWQMTPRGKPHTFKLLLSRVTTPAIIQNSIIAAVKNVKPVRSEMILESVIGYLGKINIIGAGRPTVFTRITATI